MKPKKYTIIFDILAAFAFLANGALWFTSGNKLTGILFILPAILFLIAGIINIVKIKKDNNK